MLFVCSTCVYTVFGQTTITFRDGNSLKIKGDLITTHITYEDDEPAKPRKVFQLFKELQGDQIILSVYSIWKTEAKDRMDELVVYTIDKKQIKNPAVEDETDDNDQPTHYSLFFTTDDENGFAYEVYTIYSSVPAKKNFSNVRFYSDTKTPLEELMKLLSTEE